MAIINLMQSANEHNTALLPAWHIELNMQNARAAILIGFKESGDCLLMSPPNMKKEHIMDMLKAALHGLENGKANSQIIQIPGNG
ncbi:MAG: hypothetical protein [Bacteriophage sp.]|nr:MAG: hypothetical protein [Bacteriophage sp.]